MLSLLGVFIPALKETIEMLYQWENDFVVNHDRASKGLGLAATPMNVGIQETIDWIRREEK